MLCEHFDNNKGTSQINMVIWAKKEINLLKLLGQSTISNILKQKNKFTEMSQGEL